MTFPSALPVLSALVWTPALGAVVSACFPPKWRRASASAFAMLSLLLGVGLWLGSGAIPEARELSAWIPSLGVSYELSLDELGAVLAVSIPLVALVALVGPNPTKDDGRRAPIVLLGESALLGLALAGDAFLFLAFLGTGIFVLARLTTRARATKSVFFFQSAGLSLAVGFSLAWYHLAFVQSGFPTAEIARFGALVTYPDFECRMFLLGAAAACCMAPLFPFGSWLQDAAEAITPSGRVLLFGGFSVVSAVFLLRLGLPSLPVGRSECSPLVIVLAALSTMYAAIVPYRGEPRRSFVPLVVGTQGLVMLGLLSDDSGASGAGRLLVLSVALGFSALAVWTDGEETPDVAPTPLATGFAGLLVILVLWLPASSGLPSAWVILRPHWARFPIATALATLGAIGMAMRLVLAFPVLARAGATRPRLKILRILPLLAWWLVASATLPPPEGAGPAGVLSEIEE